MSTSPTLTISEGCTVIGPTRSQFWLPLTLMPRGVSTSSWRTKPTARIGRARRFHVADRHPRGHDQRDGADDREDGLAEEDRVGGRPSVASIDTIDDADSTMISPKTTRATVTQTSR